MGLRTDYTPGDWGIMYPSLAPATTVRENGVTLTITEVGRTLIHTEVGTPAKVTAGWDRLAREDRKPT